jgi:MFS family permease
MARFGAERQRLVTTALGITQIVGYGSSYYLPAVLAAPMADSVGLPVVWVFGAFSLAMALSALVGPWAGARVDAYGGRGVLMLSNLIFAAGLVTLSLAQGPVLLFAGWALIGLGMGTGLYETAFSTLAGIYSRDARSAITGVTLIGGFASTVGWPLSGVVLAAWGWREACLVWAALHLCLSLPLHAALPSRTATATAPETETASEAPQPPSPLALSLLAFVFAAAWFNSTAMAAHLPAVLQAAGASTAMAIAAGALIGPAQVAARLAEFGLLRQVHPLLSARLAAAAHPLAALILGLFGGPAAYAFALLHGAGNGILTVAKGTLPLALFGAAGYGQRLGWLNAPARFMQAAAPLAFGAALAAWGMQALWLTAGLGIAATFALFLLRR